MEGDDFFLVLRRAHLGMSMTRPDKRALLIIAVAGILSVIFLYFELTSGG